MSEEGFFARWSRRKRAAGEARDGEERRALPDQPGSPPAGTEQRVASAPVAQSAGAALSAGVAPPAADRAPDPALRPAGPPVGTPEAAVESRAEPPFDLSSLPSIDSLTVATDIRAFLRKEVPEALRRAALRKAWSLDPAIRDFVGPADYAWDYNAPDGVPGASLDLVGDVREMLAQVFGPDTPRQDAAPAGQDVAAVPLTADAGGKPTLANAAPQPPATEAMPSAPAADAALRAPVADPAPQVRIAGADARGSETDAAPSDAHPASPAERAAVEQPLLAAAARRHGSALPS